MAEVLVLAERTADGEVKKVTLELLSAARRLGEPSVVWTGPGADGARARLAEYGAVKVYVADSPDFAGYVVAPTAELLAALVASASPAAVLVAGTTEGTEIAGRLAVKTGSGVLTDAVDVPAGADGAPLADLSLDPGSVGLANAASWVEDFAKRPPRAAGVVVKDEGDGGTKTASFLADRKFI